MFNIYYIKLLNDAESFQGKVYIFFPLFMLMIFNKSILGLLQMFNDGLCNILGQTLR